MAWLAADDIFQPDTLSNSVIGVQAELGNHDSGVHCHQMGQLLFTRGGCIKLTLNDGERLCLLPPTKIAWIPGGVSHRAEMKNTVAYRSIWLSHQHYPSLPNVAQLLNVTPLLNELLERITASPWQTDWGQGTAQHLIALCLAELEAAHELPLILRFPDDRRLAGLSADTLPPRLHDLAMVMGASERTISRIFRRDTGMSYQQWRQQWRLMKAIEKLATGSSITLTAGELDFASDSAFIYFFRSQLGQTPGSLFATP